MPLEALLEEEREKGEEVNQTPKNLSSSSSLAHTLTRIEGIKLEVKKIISFIVELRGGMV